MKNSKNVSVSLVFARPGMNPVLLVYLVVSGLVK